MNLYSWNPAWYQPGESFWSVANKLAFVSTSTVAEVFVQLAGVHRNARESWLFPNEAHAATARASLHLPVGMGSQLFADVSGAPDLSTRCEWQLAIRHCPLCFEGFVHRLVFQDIRTRCCPVHGCELVDVCPSCLAPLDPLCPEAWTCSDCLQPLVDPGRGWAAKFSSGRGGFVTPRLQGGLTPPQVLVWGVQVDRRRVVQDAYEEHSAICAALLGRHHDCIPGESEAAMVNGPQVYFDCPLAASALFLAGQLGFVAQCADGAWIPPKPRGTPALRVLESLLSKVAAAHHPEVTRVLARKWFTEILGTFSEASARGEPSACWSPRVPSLGPDDAVNRHGPVQKLHHLAAQAGKVCRSPAVSAISHREF